jgi:plasmid stabilization system protein ParE
MGQVVWAEPALNDLDAIADYIALDDPEAARRLVQKIFEHIDHLEIHPRLGSKPPELPGWRLSSNRRAAVLHLLPRRFRASLDTSRYAI